MLIQRGMLSRRQSLDLLDGLDMDFLTVGYEGNSQISGGVDGCSNGFSYEDDFFFDQQFEERSGSIGQDNDPEGIAYNQDIFRMGGTLSDPSSSSWGSNNSRSRRTSSIGISLGAGSFDIGGAFFEGLGGNILPPSSRKHSLSLPPTAGTPRSGFIHGLGSGGDVEMSAYKSMAASLEAQAQGQGHVRR